MDDQQLAKHAIRISQLSYEMECERYDSLLSSSGRLLTCISICLVALMSLLPIMLDSFPDRKMLLGVEFLVVFSVVLASLVCALIAQFRFKYKALRSPAALTDFIVDSKDKYRDPLDVARNYADNLEEPFQSVRHRNTRITRLLIASSILLWVGIGVVVFLTILDCLVLFA